MSKVNGLLYGLMGILLSSVIFANERTLISSQRQFFQQAERALEKKQFNTFNRLRAKIGAYPLQSYLQYRYIQLRPNKFDDEAIFQFIRQNPTTFYAEKVRNLWLDRLARKGAWQRYLDFYQLPQPASRQCHQLTALIETHQLVAAEKVMLTLWSTARSQHKNCDRGFQFFKSQGKISQEHYWQRIILAVKASQFRLANYLAKSTLNSKQTLAWIQRWQRMMVSPERYLSQLPNNKAPNHWPHFLDYLALEKQRIQAGLAKLARTSTHSAFKHWQRLKPLYNFDEQHANDIQASIAMRGALNRQDDTLELFGEIPEQPWRVRAALWQQNWPAVQRAIFSLSQQQQELPRWQYWLARSYDALGEVKQAEQLYRNLILERDYYGFLAADRLGETYRFNKQKLNIDPQQFSRFRERIGIQVLYEFYRLDLSRQAHRQLYFLRHTLDEPELEMLAYLVHQWGWHHHAIALLGKAKSWDDLDIRFPIVHQNSLSKASTKTQLNHSWLLAVARQESAFNERARSPVGARGLMQLMPKTARATAKKYGISLNNLSELHRVDKNIQLGSHYLRQVYLHYYNNPVLASASYNAGPHRVKRWLPKTPLPADIWIENIPFNETRKYTANVLTYIAVFDFQRKLKMTPLSEYMPAILPIDAIK